MFWMYTTKVYSTKRFQEIRCWLWACGGELWTSLHPQRWLCDLQHNWYPSSEVEVIVHAGGLFRVFSHLRTVFWAHCSLLICLIGIVTISSTRKWAWRAQSLASVPGSALNLAIWNCKQLDKGWVGKRHFGKKTKGDDINGKRAEKKENCWRREE